MNIYSIGYEKKSIAEFCTLLQAASVGRLLDVRAAAWSQRPQFRREALRAALGEHGIEYVHCKAAGNPFRPKPGQEVEFGACREQFARHVAENPRIIEDLVPHVTSKPSALFCYESTRLRCHRGVLLDALTERIPQARVVDLGIAGAQGELFTVSAGVAAATETHP